MPNTPYLLSVGADTVIVIRASAAAMLHVDGPASTLIDFVAYPQDRVVHACKCSSRSLYALDATHNSLLHLRTSRSSIMPQLPRVVLGTRVVNPKAVACTDEALFLMTEDSLFNESLYRFSRGDDVAAKMNVVQSESGPELLLGDTMLFHLPNHDSDVLLLWDRILHRYGLLSRDGILTSIKQLNPNDQIVQDENDAYYVLAHSHLECRVRGLFPETPELWLLPRLREVVVHWAITSAGIVVGSTIEGQIVIGSEWSGWQQVSIDWPRLYTSGYLEQ